MVPSAIAIGSGSSPKLTGSHDKRIVPETSLGQVFQQCRHRLIKLRAETVAIIKQCRRSDGTRGVCIPGQLFVQAIEQVDRNNRDAAFYKLTSATAQLSETAISVGPPNRFRLRGEDLILDRRGVDI